MRWRRLALTKTGDVVTEDVRERMHQMLTRIQAGELVRDWMGRSRCGGRCERMETPESWPAARS